jgi:hypothetical protein
MFKVVPDTNVPGFRVGLTDDNNESAPRPLPAVPSGLAPGYNPYSTVPQAIVPTVFRPAGLFYQGSNGPLSTAESALCSGLRRLAAPGPLATSGGRSDQPLR